MQDQLAIFTALGNHPDKTMWALTKTYNGLAKYGIRPYIYIGCRRDQIDWCKYTINDKPNCAIVASSAFNTTIGYNLFSLESFGKFSENFILTIQHDGFLLNPKKFLNNWNLFTQHDYIGAAWPEIPGHVGNSGFCLRSRKLNVILGNMKHVTKCNSIYHDKFADDIKICVEYRQQLESNHGITFAPVDVAEEFSYETVYIPDTAGFHGDKTSQSKTELWKLEQEHTYEFK
jgi:hypothetical protein